MSEDDRKLFVGGTKNADEPMLKNYFEKFGEIESCKVIYDRETDRCVRTGKRTGVYGRGNGRLCTDVGTDGYVRRGKSTGIYKQGNRQVVRSGMDRNGQL